MKSFQCRYIVPWILALTAVTARSGAQGTAQDYERANNLRRLMAGKVYRAAVVPHWIEGSGRFWYRNDLPGGRREFVLVDTATPSKRPAFDHARLASALSGTLGRA